MLNLRTELRVALAAAVRAAQKAGDLPAGPVPEVVVDHPSESGGAYGDYASPIALALGRQWKKPPMELAEIIAKRFVPPPFVGKVEGVSPGFLNVHLDPGWLSTKVDDLTEEGSGLARTETGRGESVNLEFVSANPTGEVHVGNGRALFTADMLGTVLAHAGYAVTREYYVNDVGNQVGAFGESVLRRILQMAGHAVEFPEGLYRGEEVKVIASLVREELVEDRGHVFAPRDLDDADLRAEITRRAVAANLRAIRHIVEEQARVRFDVWFLESSLHERGDVRKVIEKLEECRCLVKREGALWLKTTAFGDDKDRVLVRASGEPTYLASDIAYHRDKLRRGFQVVADFWGADHQGHILPLRAGLAGLGEDASRFRVVLVHMVRVLQGGEAKKISKRAGTSVPLREVIDLVGLSAARFFLIMKPLSSPLDFDLDLARAQKEENPVFYLQYAFVRLASILRKAKQQNVIGETLSSLQSVPLSQPAELRLLTLAFRLPEVLEDIVRTWEVQRLPQYALELARAVHRFYDTVPVLAAGSPETVRARLALVVAVETVLAKVCDLLGVEKREVM